MPPCLKERLLSAPSTSTRIRRGALRLPVVLGGLLALWPVVTVAADTAGEPKPEVAAQIRSLTIEQTRRHLQAQQNAPWEPARTRDPVLADIALGHSRAMFRAGTLAHRLHGLGPPERLARQHRALFGLAAENVAVQKHWPSEAGVAPRMVEGWMNSPGHRANIVASYDLLEVGCYGTSTVMYCTQMFVRDASRLASAVELTQRPRTVLPVQLQEGAGRRQRVSVGVPEAEPTAPGVELSGNGARLPLPERPGLYQLQLWTAQPDKPALYRIVPGPVVCVTGSDSAAPCPPTRST